MSSHDMPILISTSPFDETNNEARADSLMPLESTGATPDAQQSTVPTGTQSASPNNETDLVSYISTPEHMIKVSLFTWEDVAKARERAQSSELQTRPILADFDFTFRAVYDSPDTTTSIRIVRLEIPSVQQTVDDLVSIYSEDRNTGVITQFFAFMPEVPDGFLRVMIPVSNSLRPLGFAECRYYQFFKDLALRKKGREWDAGDLESIIEFLADYRMRD